MDACIAAFRVVVGEEGGYGADPSDPGNWTGGAVGAGLCRGTKYGISAAAYPNLDIEHLTLADAQEIYRRDYWDRIAGDSLPPPLALLVFDAAVNNGVTRAAEWLQAAVGVTEDGDIGPETLGAIAQRAGDGAALCAEVLRRRWLFMVALPTWAAFGGGWSARLSALPYHSMSYLQEG
jgi:lysozyme family protein